MVRTDNKKAAEEIVNKIISDISDRSGFGNAWEDMDSDIQDEIKAKWLNIIMDELNEL